MTVEEYFGGWLPFIDKQELKDVMDKIQVEYSKHPCCPATKDIFKAFTLCDVNNLKIVMIGMDPYPQKDVATGILFGNKKDTITLSPSLEVIKEAVIDYTIPHGMIDFDITLESWCKQGILMLNSALTVEMNRIGSHMTIWRSFISKLLANLSLYRTGIIYVLFGVQAKTFRPYINSKNNDILESPHPAAFVRRQTRMPSDIFREIERLSLTKNGEPIKWFTEY